MLTPFQGLMLCDRLTLLEGSFTHVIFVAATRCNFCGAKVETSFKHVYVRNAFDITTTNRTENCT